MGEFGSNRAAWLIAGFLGRKFMKDFLGRWSVIPVLAVAACLWNKWRARQLEGKLEQCKLEEVRRSTRRQLQLLRKKSAAGALPPRAAAGCTSVSRQRQQQQQRRPGDRLGGIPSASISTTPKQQEAQRQHLSPTAAAAAAAAASAGAGTTAASAAPKDALASELWAWLGGVGSGRRSCSADRPKCSSSQRSGGGGGGGGGNGEWRGAFYNRMGNLPRRNAFKTARGKVYLRGGRIGSGGTRGGAQAPPLGGLASVREEDEGVAVVAT
ncbi:unnamed protein product [Ectocarpus sp. 4 AP-2014]